MSVPALPQLRVEAETLLVVCTGSENVTEVGEAAPASFGGLFPAAGPVRLVVSDTLMCEQLSDEAAVAIEGAIVLAARGVCPFSRKAAVAHAANASVLVVGSTDELLQPPAVDPADLNNPISPAVAMVRRNFHNRLLQLSSKPGGASCEFTRLSVSREAVALLQTYSNPFAWPPTPLERQQLEERLIAEHAAHAPGGTFEREGLIRAWAAEAEKAYAHAASLSA